MTTREPLTIKVDLAKPCAECGQGGATGNGLCMRCTALAIGRSKPVRSPEAAAVRARMRDLDRGIPQLDRKAR